MRMRLLGEFRGLSDASGLQQVSALVRCQKLQPRPEGETNYWNEGVCESDAVDACHGRDASPGCEITPYDTPKRDRSLTPATSDSQ